MIMTHGTSYATKKYAVMSAVSESRDLPSDCTVYPSVQIYVTMQTCDPQLRAIITCHNVLERLQQALTVVTQLRHQYNQTH